MIMSTLAAIRCPGLACPPGVRPVFWMFRSGVMKSFYSLKMATTRNVFFERKTSKWIQLPQVMNKQHCSCDD